MPVYEPAPPKDGRPSINTLEGWNLHRHECAEKRLRRELGRTPTEEEITAEMEREAAEARRMVAESNEEHAPLPAARGRLIPQ